MMNKISSKIQDKTECFQSTPDDNLIYYLGDYACRSVSKVLKCEACVELIVREQNQVSLKFRDNENPRAEFVKLKRNANEQRRILLPH